MTAIVTLFAPKTIRLSDVATVNADGPSRTSRFLTALLGALSTWAA